MKQLQNERLSALKTSKRRRDEWVPKVTEKGEVRDPVVIISDYNGDGYTQYKII